MPDREKLISANALIEHLDRSIAESKGLIGSTCVAIKCYVEQMPAVADKMKATECKYYHDEFCVNDQCPMCADYCPVVDYPGVCRYENREG